MITPFAIFGFNIGPMEIIILVVLGILLFGRKLPDMGRYLGKSITEFRKGMKGLEDDVDGSRAATAGAAPAQMSNEPVRPPQRVAATAPKFEDAPSAPGANQPQV